MANQKESKLLCIDTSSGVDSLALTKGLEVIATNQAQHTREQRPFLLSNLQTLCSDAGWQWRDLEGVAVGLGTWWFHSITVWSLRCKVPRIRIGHSDFWRF